MTNLSAIVTSAIESNRARVGHHPERAHDIPRKRVINKHKRVLELEETPKRKRKPSGKEGIFPCASVSISRRK